MESDPCYQMAKAQDNLGPGKLKWDDEKKQLVCYDGNGSVDCKIGSETSLKWKCGEGAGAGAGAPNMLLLGIALSFAARFITL
jgi:hypothetical protein